MAQARREIKNIVLKYIHNLQSLGISVQRVILFGSQTRGTFGKDSDIDIAIISKEFEKMGLWEKAKYLGRAARELPYPIEALGFSPSQLKEFKQGTILDEIIRRGIEIRI